MLAEVRSNELFGEMEFKLYMYIHMLEYQVITQDQSTNNMHVHSDA